MIQKIKNLFLIFIPIITLVVWNGNATSIEVKLPLLQVLISLIIVLLSFHLLYKKEIVIHYDIPIIITSIFLFVITYKYFTTPLMSINYRAAMPQIYSILTFGVVYTLFKKEHIKFLLEIILFVSMPASLYGVLQFFNLDPINWVVISDRFRVISFFGHKNYFALYLLLIIPLNVYLSVVEKNRIKSMIFKITTALSIVALFLSYSRGAIVSFILFSSISFVLYLNRKRIDGIRVKRSVYFIPLVIIVILPFVIPARIKNDIANIYKNRELNVRVAFWQGAMEIASRKKISGVGPGNFRNEYPLNTKYKIHSHSPNQVVDHIHNDFIEVYVEYGIVAFLLYLLIVISFLVRFWKGYHQKEKSRNEYLLLLAIFCSIISFVFYSNFTVAARYTSSLFYFWITIAIGEIILESKSRKFKFEIKINTLKYVIVSVLILSSFISLYNASRRYYASHLVYKSQDHMRRKIGNAKSAIEYLDKAIAIDHKNVEAIYAKGYASFMIGDIVNAERHYLRIYCIYPAYINIAFNLASCYYKNSNWIDALYYAKESFRQYPGYTPNGIMLGYCYYYLNELKKSKYYCDMILEREPQNSTALALKQKLDSIERGGVL